MGIKAIKLKYSVSSKKGRTYYLIPLNIANGPGRLFLSLTSIDESMNGRALSPIYNYIIFAILNIATFIMQLYKEYIEYSDFIDLMWGKASSEAEMMRSSKNKGGARTTSLTAPRGFCLRSFKSFQSVSSVEMVQIARGEPYLR